MVSYLKLKIEKENPVSHFGHNFLLDLTSIGFKNFLDILSLSFSFLQLKMRHLKKICETNAGPIDIHWFHEFCLIFDLFFFTNADVVIFKDKTSKKICVTNGGQINEQDVPLT